MLESARLITGATTVDEYTRYKLTQSVTIRPPGRRLRAIYDCGFSARFCGLRGVLPGMPLALFVLSECIFAANPRKDSPLARDSQRIEERRNFLDGVVFSGGEPLLQEALQEALQEIRALGLKTALHTGGALPERFLQVLPWLDWVGFDVKTDFESYNQLTGVAGSSQAAIKSLNQLIQSGVPFECRTTLDPKWVSPLQLLQLVRVLKELGIQNYALQECYDENRQALPTLCWDPKVLGEVRSHIPNVVLRRSGGERGLLPK